jgi:hypothetical protein
MRPIVAALVLAFAGPAFAEDRTETVYFDPAKTSARVSGAVSGLQAANYRIDAGKGQRLHMRIEASNPLCFFNVFPPGKVKAAHAGATAGKDFVQAPTEPGIYLAQIFLLSAAAKRGESCQYSLFIERTGPALAP